MDTTNGTAAPAAEAVTAAQTTDQKTTGQQVAETKAGGTAVAAGAVSDAAKEVMRKHKIKVEGNEIEVDEEELKRGYSHQKVANKTMQEAIRMRKQAEQFISMMKDKGKLMDAIKKLGHDPRKLSEEYLASVLNEEVMDPKDRELKTLKTKLEQMEDMDRQQKEAVQRKRDLALKEKYSKDYQDEFVAALQKSTLPANKETVADMARYVYRAAELGLKITADEAAKLVKEDMENKIKAALGESDAETLVKLLGTDIANKVRQWDTSRVKDPNAGLKDIIKPDQPRERKTEVKRMSHLEWRKFNRGI